MLILAFDTSSDRGDVAVVESGRVLCERAWSREGSHGELLTPAIESCLHEANVKPRDLGAIAVGCGPGSFTGVRVAINAARSLGFAASIPVHTFDSSEILVAQVPRRDLPVVVLINAHKNLIFASTFNACVKRQRILPLEAYDLPTLREKITSPHLAIGDGFTAYSDLMSDDLKANLMRDQSLQDFPTAKTLARLAFDPISARPLVWKNAQALYIRASGAEENLRSK